MTLWQRSLDFHQANAFDTIVAILIMNDCIISIVVVTIANTTTAVRCAYDSYTIEENSPRERDNFSKHKHYIQHDVLWSVAYEMSFIISGVIDFGDDAKFYWKFTVIAIAITFPQNIGINWTQFHDEHQLKLQTRLEWGD